MSPVDISVMVQNQLDQQSVHDGQVLVELQSEDGRFIDHHRSICTQRVAKEQTASRSRYLRGRVNCIVAPLFSFGLAVSPARTVVIATGAQYHKLLSENFASVRRSGVYSGATHQESQMCGGEDVIVVGGGNSAGQAAVFLAQTARHVYMLVRADSLAQTMSRYPIRRIEESANITLLTNIEVTSLDGNNSRVALQQNRQG